MFGKGVCVCVCVCVRERERERERGSKNIAENFIKGLRAGIGIKSMWVMESQKAPAVPVPYFLNEIIMKITKIATDDLQTYRVYYTHSKNITRIIET